MALVFRLGAQDAGGNLSDTWGPSPAVSLQIRSSYYGPYKVEAGGRYSLLDRYLGAPEAPISLHHALLGIALLRRSESFFLPDPVLGFGLHFIRAQAIRQRERSYYFLEENESEFGLKLGLQKSIPLGRRGPARPRIASKPMALEAAAECEMVLSRPRPTWVYSFSLGIGFGIRGRRETKMEGPAGRIERAGRIEER